MLFFREIIDLRCLVFIIDAAFPSKSFDVCDLIDGECMFSVDGGTVELLGRSDGLLWGLVFDESIASQMSLFLCAWRVGGRTLLSCPSR